MKNKKEEGGAMNPDLHRAVVVRLHNDKIESSSIYSSVDMAKKYVDHDRSVMDADIRPQYKHVVYANFDKFEEAMSKEDIAKALLDLKIADLPKKASKVTLCLLIWEALIEMALDRIESLGPVEKPKVPRTLGKREGKLTNRVYVIVGPLSDLGEQRIKEQTVAALPPQAKKCIEFLTACCEKASSNQCTEPALKELVMERASELNTRQDPWRIFQYYRPQLIQAHVIRMI